MKKANRIYILSGFLAVMTGFSFAFGLSYFLSKKSLKQEVLDIQKRYEDIQNDGLFAFLRNMPLQYKMDIFYEFVKNNEFSKTTFNEYVIKLILHDTGLENYFLNYSEIFRGAWITNNSMQEANLTMSKFSPWASHWNFLNPLTSSIHNTVRNKISFIETSIDFSTEENKLKNINSAIETATDFRGSSLDIAILEATLMKHCNYETIICFVDDENISRVFNPNGFHRGFVWIKIDTTDFIYETNLWCFGGGKFEWLLLDPTCAVYGETPYWITSYYDSINFTNWDEIFTWNVIAPSNSPELELNDLIPNHE